MNHTLNCGSMKMQVTQLFITVIGKTVEDADDTTIYFIGKTMLTLLTMEEVLDQVQLNLVFNE